LYIYKDGLRNPANGGLVGVLLIALTLQAGLLLS
jgi:hypothetical protein